MDMEERGDKGGPLRPVPSAAPQQPEGTILLSVPREVLQDLSDYRDSYQQYLRTISHESIGSFNPWIIVERSVVLNPVARAGCCPCPGPTASLRADDHSLHPRWACGHPGVGLKIVPITSLWREMLNVLWGGGDRSFIVSKDPLNDSFVYANVAGPQPSQISVGTPPPFGVGSREERQLLTLLCPAAWQKSWWRKPWRM